MFVPPKFRNAPGVVAGGISSAPSITCTLNCSSSLGRCVFHCDVYLDSTLSKSNSHKVIVLLYLGFMVMST